MIQAIKCWFGFHKLRKHFIFNYDNVAVAMIKHCKCGYVELYINEEVK